MAIDFAEREDLRAEMKNIGWWVRECSACGARIERTEPLVLVRMIDHAPVMFAARAEDFQVSDPFAASKPLLDEVQQRLTSAGVELPSPALITSFDFIFVAASRDLDADLADPEAAAEEIEDEFEIEARVTRMFLADIVGVHAEGRLAAALHDLVRVTDVDAYRETYAAHPELASEQARERLVESVNEATDREERDVREAQLGLLDAAQAGEFEAGWEAYAESVRSFGATHLGPRFDSLAAELERAVHNDPDRAPVIGEELLSMAISTQAAESEAAASFSTAHAYVARPHATADEIDRAVDLFRRHVELVENEIDLGDQELAAGLLNLGAALGRKRRGDSAANQAEAIEATRRILDLDTDDDVQAKALTNLGHGLIEQGTAIRIDPGDPDRTRIDRDERIGEGIAYLQRALKLKSFERDPVDWAFTELNLGLGFVRLAGNIDANSREAIGHYDKAIRGFEAGGDGNGHAYALRNRGDARLALASIEEGERIKAETAGAVEADAKAAIKVGGWDMESVEAARAWMLIGKARLRSDGYGAAVVEAYENALHGFDSDFVPQNTRTAGEQLGHAASRAGDWETAAKAWEKAADAAATCAEIRGNRRGRFEELRANHNIFRWSADALARNGQLERAVEVLELGRARELAIWLQDDVIDFEEIRYLDRDLADRFESARAILERADAGQVPDPSGNGISPAAAFAEYEAVKAEIRQLPGQSGFLGRPAVSDIAAACRDSEVLAYPVTAPSGSLLLLVHGDGVEAIDCPGATSAAITERLIRMDPETGGEAGLLAALPSPGSDLDAEIEKFSALLGPTMISPLAETLEARGIEAVCFLGVGLLGYVPLHALSRPTPSGERLLLEDFDVVYAPSGYARRVCLDRAATRLGPGRAVIVGDPQPHPAPLRYAPFEVRAIADAVDATDVQVIAGIDATKQQILAALPGAAHIHFACHGEALVDPEMLDGGLSFAGHEVATAAEFLALDDFSPRLAVASACETGMISGYEVADEVLSLATVMIGAGAAGVIGSMWKVNDFATALLMTKTYELMKDGHSAARALRLAQLWLRQLPYSDALDFVATHPALRGGFGEQTRGQASAAFDLSAPHLWAAFTLSGA